MGFLPFSGFGFQPLNPEDRGPCPGTNTKCCVYADPDDADDANTSALPASDLLASSDLSSLGSNALGSTDNLSFPTDDNLFTSDDGSTFDWDASAFDPDQSQISYGLTADSLLGDDSGATSLLGMNDGSEFMDSFANVGEDGNPLDFWS